MINEQDVKRIIEQSGSQSQYNTGPVSSHSHNGIDSQSVNPNDLTNANYYFALTTVTLTTAQILTLNSASAVVLVAGVTASNQSSGAIILIENITAKLRFRGIAYTGVNNLEFRYGDPSGVKAAPDMTAGFINSPANAYMSVNDVTTAFVPVPGASVVMSVPIANPAAGTGSITLTAKYRLVWL